MNRHNQSGQPSREPWENDPVWKLLDASPRAEAGPRFVTDTVRAARLAAPPARWWQRLLSPAPLAGLAAAAAALALAFHFLTIPGTTSVSNGHLTVDAGHAAEIQEIAETDALLAAVEHLDDFSDLELVNLIGF